MVSTAIKNRTDQKFIPIFLDALRMDSVLNFDLYININHNLVLYRSANLPFTESNRQKLIENKVQRLFITNDNKNNYQRYIEKNLKTILTDPTVTEESKASILYDTSTNLVKDVLANPNYGENIQRSKELVSNTIGYILNGRKAFHQLLNISSFDYHIYTHSVNVCTFSIALAQQLGFYDEQFLHELGTGALLHDIGKSKISDRILHKRSGLNATEFEIIKKHPKWGVEILSETDEIEASCYYPVLQHHERGDRTGYPNGICLDEMHIYSKIVAIADSFDAMTTERVYQKAVETFPALKTMFTMRNGYDEKLLKAFVELMGPSDLLDK